ncbi:FecCD family ABC transporter permease [Desulfurococcus mucosus]|uniref:Transport system permease protein n=1 Tax=Desulfurococcus mucosus (strain ATCC 35584 / DSM 2162 / JCM 9187 / O7/1) TaxID=765177 RepID=E8R8Y9_DESM0|nr:iron ABC transporter permease [Desulfurococcus mucosus]ADV64965.1 transport system permease protein [Desulfurococcus mucosus DSM 2162]
MRSLLIYMALTVSLLIAVLLDISMGAYPVGLRDLLGYIGGSLDDRIALVVIDARVRRILTAILAGSVLSLSTLVLQSVFRNPLASPFTLGLQHAASLGAGVAIMLLQAGSILKSSTPGVYIGNPFTVSAAAFLATFGHGVLVITLSSIAGLTVYSLILASIILSFLTQSILYLMQYLFFNEISVSTLLFWSVGDLSRTTWCEIALIASSLLLLLVYAWWESMSLDLLGFSDELASSSGVNPALTRLLSILLVSLAVGVTVSFTGIIGFAGLIALYASRILVGWSTRRCIPAVLLMGSIIMVSADIIGRSILKPVVIPVGVVTSLIGSPLLLLLMLGGRGGLPKS